MLDEHDRLVGAPLLKILVTGAAGLIGGDVAARLTARGHRVTALVHNNPEVCGNDGALVPVGCVVHGDVTQPGLGIGEAGARHDLIVHCAATTRFDLNEAEYERTNVGGVANVVALARETGAALLHVGTAYVCGLRDGPISEMPVAPDARFANGYEASKAAGEALVTASDVRHAIARPSIVLGDSVSGAIRGFDTIYGAFKLMAQGMIRHLPARAGATLDFVPIDHVAGGLVAIAERMDQAAGGIYHLVSPEPIPVDVFARAIGDYPQFQSPMLVSAGGFDRDTLPPLERRLHGRVAALYSSYFQRDPRFCDERFVALTGLTCPPTGAAYLRRLINYCIAAGFLPAADQRMSG